ncbi:MAG TPA: tRNA (adenosine(37)-N6)-threonylcarbamoyltransferase complex transferase subunit TsaD, partial [Actinomycetota bacterium]|nr:tRNA (adenosine(37)-N6)-threonylcarbamoyltransferase complex transferase subunit TsaD [Actinomycetota bacterium]
MIKGSLPLAEEVLEDFDVEEFETLPFLEEVPTPAREEILTLGIETSCDETSVAVLRGARDVLSNVISSSADLHGKFGGVVPEVASRAHVEAINPAIEQALRDAQVTLSDISVIGVTIGPGLIGSLTVGVAAAKSLSSVLDIPLVGVNHLEAHLYACLLEHKEADFPAFGLIVSGGHTLLVNAVGHGLYEIIGQTLDDAVGEAFDKIGRFLGLGFPGGPAIDAAARRGDPKSVALPRAMRNEGYDFSFSGLKTAVVNHVKKQRAAGNEPKV